MEKIVAVRRYLAYHLMHRMRMYRMEDIPMDRTPGNKMNPTPGSTNTNILSNDNSFYSAPEYFSLGQNYPNPFNSSNSNFIMIYQRVGISIWGFMMY